MCRWPVFLLVDPCVQLEAENRYHVALNKRTCFVDGVEEGEAVVGELARDSPNKNVSSGQPLLDVTNDSVPDLVD
ncbi:unnamed protein product [Gongylonema pulchrum]|uniref:Uncharacterized protein n=1 Tax=Gongylonema pulchrum TaxID=637853 RepID=A0A183E773_9BILA|nr:unnamed protein product [Gongylonema pulchrum]